MQTIQKGEGLEPESTIVCLKSTQLRSSVREESSATRMCSTYGDLEEEPAAAGGHVVCAAKENDCYVKLMAHSLLVD